MTVRNKTGKPIPAWVWGVATVIAIGVVVLLASKDWRRDPPQSFRYEVAQYERVDPSRVLFEEREPITPDVPGLTALATSPEGRIYAAGTNAVVVYGLDGREIARHAINGSPTCLAVTADGEILLGMTDHVEVLHADGKPKARWPSLGERAHLTSIAANGEDIYAADAGNRVVVRFDREGNVVQHIGKADASKGIPGFVVPSPYFDVTFDNTGTFWAVNPGRHGLESYRSSGALISAWYRPSIEAEGFSGCCNPSHVAFRSDGSLVTTEKGLARVKLYSVDQKLVGFVAQPATFHDSPMGAFSCKLETPLVDLAVDSKDRVLVLDANKNAIRIFEEKASE
ncbi:MAG: hypothetical protein GWP08_08725 [Nitrospiraceae bacterium]|nr:hypothetical protein [Nitrospiraceae bacterium]